MSRNRITVAGGQLIVEPVGLDKVWSLTRRIQIPLTHVTGALFDPSVTIEPTGWRFPGLRLGGKRSGTFYAGGKKQFWNTSGNDRAIVVELDTAARFDRLLLTVDDPSGDADMINRARRP